jgi:NIPSNAP
MNKTTVLLAFASVLCSSSAAIGANKTTPCYELRIYHAAPGKLDALNARFRDHTIRIFNKHHMKSIGYWMPADNSENLLIYLLEHPSREAADQAWKDFGADPDWRKVARESEANGRLVTRVERHFMTALDFSPKIKPSKSRKTRLFELRTYTASPGKLDALHARFRGHTCKLFKKHGITNFAYWRLMPDQKGADDTLIYMIAHKSKETADASWQAFRDDPDWVAARKASEEKAGGSLTTKVESVFMTPTDYSPTK